MHFLPTASAMVSTSMRFPIRLTHLKQCSPEGSQSGKNFLLGGANSPDAESRAHRIRNIDGSNCLWELEKKMRVSGQLQQSADLLKRVSNHVSFARTTIKGGRRMVRRITTNDLRTYFDPDAVGHFAGSAEVRRARFASR